MPTNAGSTMLPLYSLLNPPLPVASICSSCQLGPNLSYAPAPIVKPLPPRVTMDEMPPPRCKTLKGSDISTKAKPRGPVNFAPFEDIDQASLQELTRFRVSPMGKIRQCCEHIPYNSAKKDFYEKTGRESIEVFKYQFQLPGDDNRYTVMWDYNIGLVRMTPFFKCLGYAKTKPSQMLDKNSGLREITPSVTGGAVSAQGYWMPYRCAKAVCATFCYCIAGALIPLFGPDFPSECRAPDASCYKEMVISQQIIIDTTQEVDFYRWASRARIQEAPTGPATATHRQSEHRRRQGGEIIQLQVLPCRPQPSRLPARLPVCMMKGDSSGPDHPTVRGPEVHHPVAASPASLASSFDCRSGPGRGLHHRVDPPTTTGLLMGQEASSSPAIARSWRPKRRRRAHDSCSLSGRGRTVAPDTDLMALTRRPEQELDRFKAAAALVSLHQELVQPPAEAWSTAIVESSDDETGLRPRKRPKALSF